MNVRVRWETLGGSVKVRTFDNWEDAESFVTKKEQQVGTQWAEAEEVK